MRKAVRDDCFPLPAATKYDRAHVFRVLTYPLCCRSYEVWIVIISIIRMRSEVFDVVTERLHEAYETIFEIETRVISSKNNLHEALN